jgi:predicted RNA polymerase sigma factor
MDFETLYREERPRALATLIRLLRDFDLAEDMLQEASRRRSSSGRFRSAGQPLRVARLHGAA